MKATYESQQVQPVFSDRMGYEEGLKSWLRDYEFKYFFTLTFRSDVSLSQAQSVLHKFGERLSKRAFGSHWKASRDRNFRVSFVASFEKNTSGRLHIHVAMQPLDHSNRITGAADVKHFVSESWRHFKESGQQLDFQMINNQEDRVISYLFKEVKYDTDSFYDQWFSAQK